ncbi:MAG: PhoH family protein [Opitutae bacterium]|jgi:PhoH-like ATPase|nr:PhoH family protein [Opitutae bacterium]MDG2345799.1 PhoH family protein [Opitutae bacterium]
MFGFYRLHEMGFLNYSKRVLRFGYNNAEIELAANINQPLPKQKTTKNEAKIFVLDTNVLLHDPQCLHKFEDNTVAIPVEVLEELDRKKSAPGELGFSARKIHRDLRSLFDEKLAVPPEMKGQGSSALSCDLPNGGRLIVVINDYFVSGDDKSAGMSRLRATLVDMEKMDSRILASCFFLKEVCTDSRVILVSKDANMALKGIALGLEVQDYMNDKVKTAKIGGGIKTVVVEDTEYECFIEEHGVDLSPGQTSHLYINEYIYLSNGEFREPARYRGDGQIDGLILGSGVGIKIPKGIRINPLNDEQRMLMDAMLDEDVKLVTCMGKAGTGKTLVSIAMALYQAIGDDNLYERVFITRPLVHIGKDTGALPGTLEEKMAPYIAPFYDNLEVLFSNRKVIKRPASDPDQAKLERITSNRKRKKAMSKMAKQPAHTEQEEDESKQPRKPYQFLFDYGMVEVEAMTYIRGRSLADTIFIIDEAQNLTPHEAKTVVSRMAAGSKVILLGDPYQVDNMFLDAMSNGLVHTAQRLKGTEITAHLELTTGVRSELADLAADLL